MTDFQDIHRRLVRLTEDRRVHLETHHPEMVGQVPRIAETLADPDRVVRSSTDRDVELFYKLYSTTPVTKKFLCVVVKVLPRDKFVITAYYTDSIKQGELLWTTK